MARGETEEGRLAARCEETSGMILVLADTAKVCDTASPECRDVCESMQRQAVNFEESRHKELGPVSMLAKIGKLYTQCGLPWKHQPRAGGRAGRDRRGLGVVLDRGGLAVRRAGFQPPRRAPAGAR
jgi:hypothetical protein